MWGSRNRRSQDADLFLADLLGADPGGEPRRRPPVSAPTPRQTSASWARPDLIFDNYLQGSPRAGEAALGELADEGWGVVASPHSNTSPNAFRPNDLVIQRALGDGRLAFVRALSDIDARDLYGRSGRIRGDTLVLRKGDDGLGFETTGDLETTEDAPSEHPSDAGETTVHLPLLTAHAARGFTYNLSGPNCVLRWARVPRAFNGGLDVVVHLHGYKSHNAMRLQDKANASGLDLSSPGVTAPTLGLVPHGRAFASRIPNTDGFTFPAIAGRDGLRRFIDAGLAAFKEAIGSSDRTLTVRRVILTGHSGGGAALNLLARSIGAGEGAHGLHYFDATYDGTSVLTDERGWLLHALQRDARALQGVFSDAERARVMRERGGSLRILFIDGTPTAPTAHAVDRFIASTLREIVADDGLRTFLRRYYRAQKVANPRTVNHSRVPQVFGGRLLADGGHALDTDARDLDVARAPAEDTPATPAVAPLDRVRVAIDTTLHSYRNVVVAVPAPVGRDVSVPVPYFINKPTSPSRLRAEQRRPALLQNEALSRLYRRLPVRARVGKSHAADVRAFLQDAIDANAVPGQASGLSAAGLKAFLSDVGVGLDCSAFVSQALNACMSAFNRSERIDTNSSNLRGGTGHNTQQFDVVSRPSDLSPGDTMWKTGHVRIIHTVEPQADGSVHFTTAESSSVDLVGAVAKTWRCPQSDRFASLQVERAGRFQPSVEVNVFSRYRPLADVLRGGRTTSGAEDVPSVVGSPRRTASEWHRAAQARFLGKLPERTSSGKGSAVLASVMVPASDPADWGGNVKARQARDETFLKEILNGNIPRFLRGGTVVTVAFTGKDKEKHTIQYQVMKDYLTVGNTRDHVIVPLIPATAQRIADALGCILPTRKMVDQIFHAAGVKLNALPRDYWMQGQIDATGQKVPKYDPTKDTKLVTHAYDEYLKKSDCQVSTAAYLEHNLAITQQLKGGAGIERNHDMPLIAGHKKDLVISKSPRKDRLQAYGWFTVTNRPDGTRVGKPIQDFVETAHDPAYVDYSHAARMVAGTMLVDDTEMTAAEVLAHDVYSWGLSTEGPIKSPRVPGVPVPGTS